MQLDLKHWFSELNGIGLAVAAVDQFVHHAGYRSHTHDVVEVLYLKRGTAIHRLNGVDVPMRAGTLAVVHYGQSHDILPDQRSISLVNLLIDLPRLNLHGRETDPAVPSLLPPLPTPGAAPLHLQVGAGGEHELLLALMVSEQMARRPGYQEVLQHLLMAFLIRCYRSMPAPLRPPPPFADRIQLVHSTLQRNFEAPPSLIELAELAGCSKEHLCRQFKQRFGRTMREWVTECRLQYAKYALRTSSASVLEISCRSGFGDLSTFNRAFKEWVGETPTSFRRRLAHRVGE